MSTLEAERPASLRFSLATLLLFVTAIAGACGVVVQIKRCYATIPTFRAPAFVEEYVTTAVLLWLILGSLAVFAIRKHSPAQLASVFALSCVITLSFLSVRATRSTESFPCSCRLRFLGSALSRRTFSCGSIVPEIARFCWQTRRSLPFSLTSSH